jgi:putative nucleotidyltransferase with HDIG domain
MIGEAKRATVLVVDDERGPRESLRMILAPAHRVLLAANGSEALERLRSTPIDLVTLDLNMPGIKGDELMEAIRGEFPHVDVIVITGYATVESATQGIRAGVADYLQKPFDVVQVSTAVGRAVSRQADRRRVADFLANLGDTLGRESHVRSLLGDLERNPRLAGRLGDLLGRPPDPSLSDTEGVRTIEFLEALTETVESRDPFLRGHAQRVSYFAGLIAECLGLSGEDQEHVRIAGFLHDLGQVALPADLSQRPGALSPAERLALEDHARVGARLVAPLGIPDAVVDAIAHHHEWWNGSGYPDALRGDQIPLGARIVHLADAFDAMTSDRCYRAALPRDAAIREVHRYAEVQFDPNIAKEFVSIVETGACDDLEVVAGAISGAHQPSRPVEPSTPPEGGQGR